MAKSKFFEVRCKTCDKMVKAEFKSIYELDATQSWYKCPKCKQTMLATPIVEKISLENSNLDDHSSFKEYTPNQTFKLGDAIYHKGFESRGIVTAKEVSTSGVATIMVEFDKVGMRKLVESIKN